MFPGRLTGKTISDNSLHRVLHRLAGPEHTAHGFRSAFRDFAAERTGFAPEIAEAALAHTVKSAVERAYKRTTFFDQRRKLMAGVGGALRRSVARLGQGSGVAGVIPMPRITKTGHGVTREKHVRFDLLTEGEAFLRVQRTTKDELDDLEKWAKAELRKLGLPDKPGLYRRDGDRWVRLEKGVRVGDWRSLDRIVEDDFAEHETATPCGPHCPRDPRRKVRACFSGQDLRGGRADSVPAWPMA